ncbi:MAG: alpha/beta hydrolase [Candidatus Caldatribacteriota bacterium]
MLMMSTQKHFILLRGLTRESRHWGDFPSLLRKAYPQSEIILLDLPGAGLLHKEKCPLSVDEITKSLRKSLTQQDLLGKNSMTFIGVSLGGMVAMKWAELYPEDLSEIILINSSAGSIIPIWKRLKPDALITLVHASINPKKQHSIIFDRVCRRKENKELLIKAWERIHLDKPVSFFNANRQIYAAARFKLSQKIQTRGLVLTSEGDDLVSSDCSKAIAKYLNYPLKIHPWAGHELPDDDPEWVLKQILNFC